MISALPIVLKRQLDEEVYRSYTADALRITAENIGRIGGGLTIERRYVDLINPPEEETRTEQEIIDHVRKRGWGGDGA